MEFSVEDLQPLDATKLAAATVGERGEIVLLQWLSTVEKALSVLPEDVVRSSQAALQNALLGIIAQSPNVSSPMPRPGRPIRAITARNIVLLLQKGDQRPLFDVVQTLVRAFASPKPAEKEYKVAILYAIGEVMLQLGDQVMSMSVEIVGHTLRTLKAGSQPVILRHAAIECLRKTLATTAKAINDALLKDIAKSLKGLLNDKAAPLQRAAANCLSTLYSTAVIPITIQEIDSVLSPAVKAFDSVDLLTRSALAGLVAGLLAASQVEGSAAVLEKRKPAAAKKDGQEETDDPYPTTTIAASTNSTKTLMSVSEMLGLLANAHNRSSTTRKMRIGIIAVYAALFTLLGPAFVEQNYTDILKHLISDIANGTKATSNTVDTLLIRHSLNLLLRQVIGIRLLTEQGQVLAIREITTIYLNAWPAMLPGSISPTKNALVVSLQEVAGLLLQLGSAPSLIEESLATALLRLPEHQSHVVQVAAAWCLRCFCFAAPTRLAPTISLLLELLNKDLSQIGQSQSPSPSDAHARTRGRTLALAALTSLIPSKPLYASYDTSTRVMSLAIQLLKQSANHDLYASSAEIHTAWTLVSSLLTLGPSFTRIHLPQLLILWKNALPKVTSKDSSASQVRSETEWSFLFHIRECTLGALLSFLKFNPTLVTPEVARRVAVLLTNGLAFATTFAQYRSDGPREQSDPVNERSVIFQRRLFQCFLALGVENIPDTTHALLLPQLVHTIADVDSHTGSLVQAAISPFSTVWDAIDQSGFGVTTLCLDSSSTAQTESYAIQSVQSSRDLVEVALEELTHRPVLEGIDFDSWRLFEVDGGNDVRCAVAASTGVVDAAIQLLGVTLTAQSLQAQTNTLRQILSSIRSQKLERLPGRRMAIAVNATMMILVALSHVMHNRRSGESFSVPDIHLVARDIIRVCSPLLYNTIDQQTGLTGTDDRLRCLASETLGRLCALAGTSFMSAQVQSCVTQVVENTDPYNRAGNALALGEIYRHVGALSAGPVLKTAVDILMSLSADPHPVVHYWSLQAISIVIDAASLSYAPFTNATLGAVCKLYATESHEGEGGSPVSVNVRGECSATRSFCSIVDAIIRVLGPDMAEQSRLQDIILILLGEFRKESDQVTTLLAIAGVQHLLMFVPDAIELGALVKSLRTALSSQEQSTKTAAINSVYQLVQRNAVQVSQNGGDRLIEDFFALLDSNPSVEGVREVISSWLRQTAAINPSGWLDICQRIMSKATATQQVAALQQTAPGFADEESQGLGDATEKSGPSRNISRWRTQLFALQCVHHIFTILVQAGRREHFDLTAARESSLPMRNLLINRVSDLIKMAFTASTAPAMAIRLAGLVVLKDVIQTFAASVDPDFDGALLLEQYQAPITAALTPAFSVDSFPEVLASGVHVCAIYIGSGVVKDVNKMGRILRLLTSALDNCRDNDMENLGDFKNLTSTASSLLKISIFAAWAELQANSIKQPYLQALVKPQLPQLCPAWTASLREFARLRVDSQDSALSQSSAFESGASAGIDRAVAMPYHERACLPILQSISTLLRVQDADMLSAIGVAGTDKSVKDAALFFHVVYGLAFDLISSPTPFQNKVSGNQHVVISLQLIETLVSPSIAGSAFLHDGLFDELVALCARLIITETSAVQLGVISVIRAIILGYRAELGPINLERDSNSAKQPVENCLKIILAVMQRNLAFTDPQHSGIVLSSCWEALLELADTQQAEAREKLYALALSSYAQSLRMEKSGASVETLLTSIQSTCAKLKDALPSMGGDLLPRVYEALVASCLQNVEDAGENIEGPSIEKVKANLLAATMLLSQYPEGLKAGQADTDHACEIILRLSTSKEDAVNFLLVLSKTHLNKQLKTAAISCLRNFVLRDPSNSVSAYCMAKLLPNILARLLQDQPTTTTDEAIALIKLLGTFATAASPESGLAKYGIALPALVGALGREGEAKPVSSAAVTELLNLATQNSANFRPVTGTLPPAAKADLEAALRGAAGPAAPSSGSAPAINLKFSFANKITPAAT